MTLSAGPDTGRRAHLVLNGTSRRCCVRLDEAALRISEDTRSEFLHPLRRIDRVTACGDVWWQTDALAALAQAGAPVGILDGEGRLKAVLMPCNIRRSSLADLLENFLRRPDWPDRIEDWRRAEISIHARALRLPDPALAARMGWSGAEEVIRLSAGPLSRARARRLATQARSFAELLAQRILRDGGCPAKWLGAAADPYCNLTPIFAQIILWRLARRAATAQGGKMLRKALRRDAGATGRFAGPALAVTAETATPALRRALERDLHRFYSHLLDLTMRHKFRNTRGKHC